MVDVKYEDFICIVTVVDEEGTTHSLNVEK